jgi:hypothetical protein
MTEPTVVTPEVVRAGRRATPVVSLKPALTNRAAGQLKRRQRAARGRDPEEPEVEPENTGFSTTRYEPTAGDLAIVAGADQPLSPPPGPEEMSTGAEDGGAPPPGSGEVTTGAEDGAAAPPGAPAGPEPPSAAFAAPPIGMISTPDELAAAVRLSAAALPQAQLAVSRLDAPLSQLTSAARARTSSLRAGGRVGRIPPPRPIDPIEIDPVPEQTRKLVSKLNAQLPQLELPAIHRLPGGAVPTLGPAPEGEVDPEELASAATDQRVVSAIAQQTATEQGDRAQAIDTARKPEPEPQPSRVPDPPVLVDFRRPAPPVPAVEQTLADKANVTRALAIVLAETPKEAKGLVQTARDAAFPPDRMATYFMDITDPMEARAEKDLDTAMDKLRQVVEIARSELDAAIAARREELRLKAAGQAARRDDVATAASMELTAEARKQLAKEEAARQRAERQRVRRLMAALHSGNPKLIDELVALRMQVIGDDVAKGVVAHEQAAKRRRDLIDLYEGVYMEAYRKADDEWQLRQDAERRSAPTENGKVWMDVVRDELAAAMQKRRDATDTQQAELTKAVQEAGAEARAAVRAWADKRTRAKLTADGIQRRAAEDAARQAEKLDEARALAVTNGTRDRLLNQVRLVAAVHRQDADLAAGKTIDDAHKLGDAATEVGRRYLQAADPGDPMSAVAATLRAQFQAEHLPTMARSIQDQVIALRPTAEPALSNLAEVVFPGGSEGMASRIDKLWDAFETWKGTDEDAVYEQLDGLDAQQQAMLAAAYAGKFHQSLDGRLDSELGGDDYDRAMGLRTGDKVRTAKAVIGQSEGWFSNDKQMALDAISALPPGEAAEVVKDPSVKATLGRVLADWRQTRDGRYVPDKRGEQQLNLLLELNKIKAKPGGRITPEERDLQARIDAVELDRALRRRGAPDLDAMQRIYDRMRATLMADPRTAAWPADEFDNELRRRTRAMESAYEQLFGGELSNGRVGALRAALVERFTAGEKLDIASAQLNVDRVGELAGRLQLSTRGLYAADSDVNKALAANYQRAYAEVQRSRQQQKKVQQRFEELRDRNEKALGRRLSRWEEEAYRKEANELVATELAQSWFKDVTTRFGGKYGQEWGGDQQTALKEMLVDTTQFSGEDEALARMANGGGLTVAQQVRFGVEGWGMDADEVLGGIKGRTQEQLDRAAAAYQADYHESMLKRLQEESGGWDPDDVKGPMERNAFDVREALRGVPTNAREAMEAATRRFEYERDTYFAGNPVEREYAVGPQLSSLTTQHERTLARYKEYEQAKLSGDRDQIRRAEAAFANQSEGVYASAENYRAAVDNYVDGQVQIAAVVAAVCAAAVVMVATGGLAAPGVIALASSLAGTAATIATKSSLLGAAYGRGQLTDDLVIGAVDAAVSVLTARLGNILLRIPKPTGATRAALQASMRRIAAQRAAKPLLQRVAATTVEQVVQAAPTGGVTALLDRKNWNGDIVKNVLGAAAFASVSSIAAGTAVSKIIEHGPVLMGNALDAMRRLKRAGAGAEVGADTVLLRSAREILDGTEPPRDRLWHQGTPRERLAARREYLARFPDKTPEDFRLAVERGTASLEAGARAQRELQSEMTRQFLSGIPPNERGRYTDVPIVVLSDAEFTARTGSERRGHAVTLVIDREPVVVMREGAPLSALREEGLHARQIRDRANAAKVALLEESRLTQWASASLEERIAAWNAKLDLEIDAQAKVISDLEAELAKPGRDLDARADLADRLDDARAAHRVLSGRRAELAAIDLSTQAMMKDGRLEPPRFLDDEPRLFAKKGAKGPAEEPILPEALEATDDPNVRYGPVQVDPDTGQTFRWAYKFDEEGKLLHGETFVWERERAINYGPVRVDPDTGRPYRWVYTPDAVGAWHARHEQRFSAPRGIWVRSGQSARWGGGVAEMASKLETAARMGVGADQVKRVQFDAQTERGHGFDDVVFSISTGKTGEVTVRVGVIEVKDYPGGPVGTFSAIDRNFKANLTRVRSRIGQLLAQKRWADAGLTEAEAKAVLDALDAKRVDIEVRTTSGTRLSGDPLPELERRLRKAFGKDIAVSRGSDISPASLVEADVWFETLERYRLGGPATAPDTDLAQFHLLAQRPSGYTPDSIAVAEAVIAATRDPSGLVKGPVTWAPGGQHLVDAVGPLVVQHPARGFKAGFDPVAAARGILDAADQSLLARDGVTALPRVLVDYGALSRGEAQALRDALRADAKGRGKDAALARCLEVDYPAPAKVGKGD